MSLNKNLQLDIISDCDDGWFGPGCKYRCWCPENDCKSNGECMGGAPCITGWFGPSCQYMDLIMHGIRRVSNSNGSAAITADLDDAFQFSWLRIIFNITDSIPEPQAEMEFLLKDKSGNKVDCANQTVFIVDVITVDIHCKTNTSIAHIMFRGIATLRIERLLVNGGRNLALKQNTSQSSNYELYGYHFVSKLAVDGSVNAQLGYHSCSHTNFGDDNPTWFVHFARSVLIYKAVIYNRNVQPERLKNFVLKMINGNGKAVHLYYETGPTQAVYNIPLKMFIAVDEVSIQVESVLTLCEVEIYGEIICPKLKWGLDCLSDCQCETTEVCSPITGKCDRECPPGFYGLLCDQHCPINCLNKQCDRNGGRCIECDGTHLGDVCEMECPPDNYGRDCLLTCPSNCKKTTCKNSVIDTGKGNNCSERVCDHNGLCNACHARRRYGWNCTVMCPSTCQFDRCDSKDGSCLSCNTGFYGNNCTQICGEDCKDGCNFQSGFCNDCESRFYGDDCSLPCPAKCINGICHGPNGTCTKECAAGLYGPNCTGICSANCPNQACHTSNGSCKDNCETGLFGANCSEFCPRRCSNRLCDFNGSCFACSLGFYGLICNFQCSDTCTNKECDIISGLCSEDKESKDLLLAIIISLASIVVVCAIIGSLVLIRRNDDDSEYGEEEEGDGEEI